MSFKKGDTVTTPLDIVPQTVLDLYHQVKIMPDGRLCGIHRLLFHWTLHVDIGEFGYTDRYCYDTLARARAALDQWDGIGDPDGWHRHQNTGRRRDLATGREWIAF
jgi:hypothetical protein